ncbi:MAG: hypothetical protein AAGP08_16390 [Pseudomonadota bacterium]
MGSVKDERSVLSICLMMPETEGEPRVQDIELQCGNMRHKITCLSENRAMRHVLARPLAGLIERVISGMEANMMVLSEPDAELHMPGLNLRGIQGLSSQRGPGQRRIVLRFVEVDGDVRRIFREVLPQTQAVSRAIAMEAIERVVGRTYDVACVYETIGEMAEPAAMFDGCAKDIMKRREDLLFRLDLLQRAVKDRKTEEKLDAEITRLIALPTETGGSKKRVAQIR